MSLISSEMVFEGPLDELLYERGVFYLSDWVGSNANQSRLLKGGLETFGWTVSLLGSLGDDYYKDFAAKDDDTNWYQIGNMTLNVTNLVLYLVGFILQILAQFAGTAVELNVMWWQLGIIGFGSFITWVAAVMYWIAYDREWDYQTNTDLAVAAKARATAPNISSNLAKMVVTQVKTVYDIQSDMEAWKLSMFAKTSMENQIEKVQGVIDSIKEMEKKMSEESYDVIEEKYDDEDAEEEDAAKTEEGEAGEEADGAEDAEEDDETKEDGDDETAPTEDVEESDEDDFGEDDFADDDGEDEFGEDFDEFFN